MSVLVLAGCSDGQPADANDAAADASSVIDVATTDGPIATDAVADATSDGGPKGFVHPGILLGTPQLDFIKQQLTNKAAPWTAANTKMMGSKCAFRAS